MEPVLLHAGGWDEILLVAVPIALFALFRWLASRREEDQPEDGEEGRIAPALVVAVGGLVAVGVLVAVLVPSGSDEGAADDDGSGVRETLLGLCAAADAAAEGSVEDARDVFFDRSHQGLHDLAASASEEDRTATADLLESKQRVESMVRGDPSQEELRSELRGLLEDARDAARAIDVTPPPCPEGD